MKKSLLLFSILLFVNVVSFAQAAKPKVSANDYLCDKEWHIVSVEEWGIVAKPPADKNKNDLIKLGLDGKFSLIMFGITKSGTYVKSATSIVMTDEATKAKINFKILSSDATHLKVDHYSEEDGHSTFEYEVK